jgi:hypothetical protein
MDIVYGIKVQESGDRYISLVEEVITRASEVAVPGAFLVDLFPILKYYVPSWFPGAGFQRKAAYMPVRKLNATLLEKPVETSSFKFFPTLTHAGSESSSNILSEDTQSTA